MEKRFSHALAVTLVLLVGCDPAFRFAGRVTTSNGLAIAGADVWIDCRNGSREFRTKTDRDGRFEAGGLGWRPAKCDVVASAPGYADAMVPVMSVCRAKPSHISNACLEIVADSLRLNDAGP
jgi:hypothetical protein